MTNTASGVRLRITRLGLSQAQAQADVSAEFIKPDVNIRLSPALAAAYFKGLTARPQIAACFVDLSTKKDDWVRRFAEAVAEHTRSRAADAPLLVCLAVPDGFESAPSDPPWLEPEKFALTAPDADSGFALWEPQADLGESEDTLARLLWSHNDYELRWKTNRGRSFYYTRGEESTLRQRLAAPEPFALVGQSLAGKTRLLLRALAERGQALLVARHQPEGADWRFPTELDGDAWVVFDDIDKMLDNAAFADAFRRFADGHTRWAATCRSGEAYEKLLTVLSTRARETVQPLLIGRLTPAEVERVAVQLLLTKNTQRHSQAPRNIGYYFLDTAIETWRTQYAALPENEVRALRAAAAAIRLGATLAVAPDTLNAGVPRRLAEAGLPAYLAGPDFDQACAALTAAADAKGWWEYKPANAHIELEPIFVERIIDEDGAMSSVAFLLRALALPGNAVASTPLFASVTAIARWAEQAGNAGMQLDPGTYADLAPHLAPLRDAAPADGAAALRTVLILWFGAADAVRHELLAFIRRADGDATSRALVVTINQLLRDALTCDDRDVLALFARLGVQPDNVTFNTLLSRSPSGEAGETQRRTLLADMRAASLAPDVFTFTILIEKAGSDAARQKLLADMRAAGVAPNVVTFTTLIEKAGSDAIRQKLLADMRAAGVAPNVVTFNTLIEKAGSDAARQKLLADMRAAGLEHNVVTFTTLIEKAGSEASRLALLADMRAAGLAPNVVTFTTLIEKAGSEATRLALLADMRAAGLAPNVVTFTTLIEKAGSEASRLALFSDMRTAGVAPNVVTFNTLIEKAGSEASRLALLADMRAAGLAPDVVTFTTLIEKAGSEATRLALLADMRAAGLAPNVVTFTTLIEKAGSEATRLALLAEMRAAGLAPNVVTFTTLIDKPGSDASRLALLADMRAAGLTPDVFTFTILIKRARGLAAVEELWREMRETGQRPDSYTMSALVKQAPNFATAKRLVAECQQAGARLNEHVFTAWRRLARTDAETAELAELTELARLEQTPGRRF